jgi:ribosomal protein S20
MDDAKNPVSAAEGSVSELPIKDLSGADLAIEVDTSLLSKPAHGSQPILPFALYAIGIVVVGLAALDQHRKKRFEQTDNRHATLQTIAKRLLDAVRSGDAHSLVAALRAALPHVDDSERAAIDGLLADLEARIYAPQSAGMDITPSAADRASRIAKSILP